MTAARRVPSAERVGAGKASVGHRVRASRRWAGTSQAAKWVDPQVTILRPSAERAARWAVVPRSNGVPPKVRAGGPGSPVGGTAAGGGAGKGAGSVRPAGEVD